MISHKHRCVFIHLPKCGGQSVEDVFISDCGLGWDSREPLLLRKNDNIKVGPPWLAHLSYREYLDYSYISAELMEQYFKFSVVRNPYDRLASIYKYLGYCYVMSFDDFINKETRYQLKANSDRRYFFKPQKEFLVNDQGNISVDKIIKLEEISSEILDVFNVAGIKLDGLPHVNASPKQGVIQSLKSKAKYLRKGYFSIKVKNKIEWSERLKEAVYDFYLCDFEEFGYSRRSGKS